MGNCFSSIKQSRETRTDLTVTVLGLDGAGKTTLTKCLLGEHLDTAPTVGFNNEKVTFGNHNITLYDVGGGKKIRDIWKNYFGEVYGIIYVVDASASDRMTEVRDNFHNLLGHTQVSGKPVLFLANKQDLGNAFGETEITAELDIENVTNINQCPCKIVTCSAIKGTGNKMDKNIRQGMKWLCSVIDNMLDKLKVRVDEDMRIAEETQQKENVERKERVKKIREERDRLEEEEKKQSGQEEQKQDTDDGDMIVGNPFKRLDYNELDKKDKKMKKSTNKKDEERGNTNGQIKPDLDSFHVPLSSRSLKSYGLTNDNLGENQSDESTDDNKDFGEDFLKIPTPSRLTSILPPIKKPIGSKLCKEENAIEKKKKKESKHNIAKKPVSDLHLNRNAEDPLGELYAMSNNSISSITRIRVSTVTPASSEEDVIKRHHNGYPALDADIDSSGLSGSTPRDGESKGKQKKKKRFLRDVKEKQMHKAKDSLTENPNYFRVDNYSRSFSPVEQSEFSHQGSYWNKKYEMSNNNSTIDLDNPHSHNNLMKGETNNSLDNSYSFGPDTLKFDDDRLKSSKAPVPARCTKASLPIVDEDCPTRLPKGVVYNSRCCPSDDNTEMSERSISRESQSLLKKSTKSSDDDILPNVPSGLKWNFAEDLSEILDTSTATKFRRRPNLDDDDDIVL